MYKLHFLVVGLLAALFLAACGMTASTSPAAQPAGASPEITIYKSPTTTTALYKDTSIGHNIRHMFKRGKK